MQQNPTSNLSSSSHELDAADPALPACDVSDIIGDWEAILTKLENGHVKLSEGAFRWPHHGFFTRYSAQVDLPLEGVWQEIDRVLAAQPEMVSPRLIESCCHHAWEAGKVLSLGSMDMLRPLLDPDSQGRMLAGASERELEWVAAHLDAASLTPETLLEIATNAARRRDAALLARVLQKGAGLMGMSFRRMEPLSDGCWSDDSRWSEQVAQLSHRVADVLLETFLVRACPEGVELALQHGADPNIRLWQLERSFNAWYTSVSFPLDRWPQILSDEKDAATASEHVTSLLIQHPAFAKGGRHFPALMEALLRGRHDLCDRLLAAGVIFQSEETPSWIRKTVEGGNVDWSRCYWLWSEDAQARKARKLADKVPLIPASEASWFHSPGAQGGTWMTPLSLLLNDKSLPLLTRYAAAGLSLKPTYQDCLRIIQNKAAGCLRWLMDEWQITPDERPRLLNLITQ